MDEQCKVENVFGPLDSIIVGAGAGVDSIFNFKYLLLALKLK